MTRLAIIRRTLAYAIIGTASYHLMQGWSGALITIILFAVLGTWLVDMLVCLVSRVRQ